MLPRSASWRRRLFEEEETMSNVAESIRRGLEEAIAYAEGTADTSRYGVHIPENIDVKAIRTKLDKHPKA